MLSYAGLIEEKNGLKYPLPGDLKAAWQKEWYHFCIVGPGFDLLVNLNVSADNRPAASAGSRAARVVMMAHDKGWSGDVEPVDSRFVTLVPGEVAMRLGQSELFFRDDRFELTAALQSSPMVIHASLEPLCTPLGIMHEVDVGEGGIGWFVIPRLAVTGRAVIGDCIHSLEGTTAYHDHNWGHWLWGQDFSWEWGFGHLSDLETPWTVVFDRTLNRARTRVLESTLALWRGESLFRIFSRHEINVRPTGYSTPSRLFRIPRPLAMAVPQLGRDVPRGFEVSARAGADQVSLLFATSSEAQILVPNETDLESTIITEVLGRIEISGEVRGCSLAATGRSVFEFLST